MIPLLDFLASVVKKYIKVMVLLLRVTIFYYLEFNSDL